MTQDKVITSLDYLARVQATLKSTSTTLDADITRKGKSKFRTDQVVKKLRSSSE